MQCKNTDVQRRLTSTDDELMGKLQYCCLSRVAAARTGAWVRAACRSVEHTGVALRTPWTKIVKTWNHFLLGFLGDRVRLGTALVCVPVWSKWEIDL